MIFLAVVSNSYCNSVLFYIFILALYMVSIHQAITDTSPFCIQSFVLFASSECASDHIFKFQLPMFAPNTQDTGSFFEHIAPFVAAYSSFATQVYRYKWIRAKIVSPILIPLFLLYRHQTPCRCILIPYKYSVLKMAEGIENKLKLIQSILSSEAVIISYYFTDQTEFLS